MNAKAMVKKMLNPAVHAALYVGAPFFSRKSELTPEKARQSLMDVHAMPHGEPHAENSLLPPVCDLQIIVPAYNVEAYIEDCMESILNQETKYSYKVVLIDDGSTDRTPQIADKYGSNEHVIVIHQENAGFSGARNRGLKQLFGRYIMFVDSDDMLCPGAIEALMDAAVTNDYDIVEGGAFSLSGTEKQVFYAHPAISTQKKFHGMPWAKVFKARFFESIVFPEGFWFEDSIFSFLIYPVAERVCMLNAFVYIYRINRAGSITASYYGKSKSLDTYWITEKLMETRRMHQLENDQQFLDRFLHQTILNGKRIAGLPEMIQESAFVLQCQLMQNAFPEEMIASKKRSRIVQALVNRDWGIYRMYCKMILFT